MQEDGKTPVILMFRDHPRTEHEQIPKDLANSPESRICVVCIRHQITLVSHIFNITESISCESLGICWSSPNDMCANSKIAQDRQLLFSSLIDCLVCSFSKFYVGRSQMCTKSVAAYPVLQSHHHFYL